MSYELFWSNLFDGRQSVILTICIYLKIVQPRVFLNDVLISLPKLFDMWNAGGIVSRNLTKNPLTVTDSYRKLPLATEGNIDSLRKRSEQNIYYMHLFAHFVGLIPKYFIYTNHAIARMVLNGVLTLFYLALNIGGVWFRSVLFANVPMFWSGLYR